ncbi:MAG TPA: DHH family phosphoesterase, partial [Acidisarcina sp.]
LGLDLIVTDHHLTEAGTVPRALAVLNPNQPGCSYACKHICGAGVAFKLAQALLEAHDAANGTVRARTKILPSFLKMLAIATIADAVPLLGENRVFASIGMEQLRRPAHPGLRALFELVKLDPAKRRLTSTDIAFRIAPRINAAGRMDIASEVVELFTTKDAPRACELAEKLDRLNTDRRTEEAAILKQIEDQLADPVGGERLRAARVIVLDGDGWHRGIIGILASRVVERTNRPALVISNETQAEIAARNGGASNGSTADKIPADGTLAIGTSANGKSANGRSASGSAGQSHGSGRSVPGFHLLDAIESCRDLFSRYGGHAHAVGFSLPTALVPELRARIATYAAAHLDAECLERPLECHAELSFDEITPEFYAVLRRMEPMGMGNEEPIFVARRVRVATPPRVIKERHIKVVLTAFRPEPPQSPTQEYAPPPSSSFTALGWHWADRIKAMGIAEGSLVDIAYRLRENEHPDFGGLELEIVALELALPH